MTHENDDTFKAMIQGEAAREARGFYDALIAEGFNDDQAIRLIGTLMGTGRAAQGAD